MEARDAADMPRWTFPMRAGAGPDELVAVGGDLEPETVLDAYRRGLFPMRVAEDARAGGRPIRVA